MKGYPGTRSSNASRGVRASGPGAEGRLGLERDDELPLISAVGRRVGDFVLGRFVEGRGPEAVFRARGLGGRGVPRSAAVKILRTPSPEPDLARSFRREREALAALRHPSIPRVLASGTTADGWSWYASDLVVGRPLIQHATVEGLGMDRRLRLVLEMCRAVDHAHRRGVLHPDLTRESLVVTPSGEPRVIGFGIPGTGTGANVESLGRILYELLSDVRPYLTVLRGGGPPRPAYLPRTRPRPRLSIDHVCLEALRCRGREGYGSAGELAADLQRVLDRQPLSVDSFGVGAKLRRFLARWQAAVPRTT
jgi:serine/threonine-protein kinase